MIATLEPCIVPTNACKPNQMAFRSRTLMSKADILIWCTKRAPQPLNLLSVYRYSNIFRTPMGVPLKIMEVTSLRLRDPLDQSSTGQRGPSHMHGPTTGSNSG